MSSLPRPLRVLRNATLADGSVVDVELAGGLVVSTRPAARDYSTTEAADELDLTGFVLLPAPAEPHAHLDKARSWDLIAPPMGDLVKAIESWHAFSDAMTVESIADRARAQALAMLRNGTTAIRCHVDLLPGPDPLRGARALLQVRDELRDLLDLELVTLCTDLVPDAVIEEALDLGLDLVGGAPHLASDPLGEVRRLLAIAESRGVGADLHTDEALDGELTILEFARIVRDWDVSVSAGHCVRLGTLEPGELAEVVDAVLASDIGIITLPITNLYLQGWEHAVATPRGLTAVRALLDAGVRLGAGAD
ncbi:amidohydrolase family protein, partial [Pseudolysinimonas sp.]|uniref:amidohydrolase family protein n=1 Tax=Pseudolysinimonas sp. TaxID=2680009 RepID=UPI00286A37D8